MIKLNHPYVVLFIVNMVLGVGFTGLYFLCLKVLQLNYITTYIVVNTFSAIMGILEYEYGKRVK